MILESMWKYIKIQLCNKNISFYRCDATHIHIPNDRKNHTMVEDDKSDDALEKQVHETLHGLSVQEELRANYSSGPRSLARLRSIIVPCEKSTFFSSIPLVLFWCRKAKYHVSCLFFEIDFFGSPQSRTSRNLVLQMHLKLSNLLINWIFS